MLPEMRRLIAEGLSRLPQPKQGVVSAVDPVRGTVRVLLKPEDIETTDLPYPALASGGLRGSLPLEIGTAVAVTPLEGDGEVWTIHAIHFDSVQSPPVSPQTGKVAQPGEWLVTAGQATPPQAEGQTQGAATQNSAWFHLTQGGFYAGAGGTTLALTEGSFVISVGGTAFTFTSAGMTTASEVTAKTIPLSTHLHSGVQSGASNTGKPVA